LTGAGQSREESENPGGYREWKWWMEKGMRRKLPRTICPKTTGFRELFRQGGNHWERMIYDYRFNDATPFQSFLYPLNGVKEF